MSFQALARTWRPRRFDELVGQTHVVRALTHALDNDKLHHALLFSGTRGVGKTTLGRIIAKCLNCERGVSAHPCTGDDTCGTCREIDEGRYVDLIEVDAASRTGVDDTRDLMDNVQYAPTRGRTKVYLIDEVHMLTKHSFNALLKTLEEPPPRVQFLLATTEPEKIPVTILSRCLQFPLKRLPASEIARQLHHIVAAESLAADDDALDEIARAADGSMRDGLSLLDQAVAFGGGRLGSDDVREMLGSIGEARVVELVAAIIAARPAEAVAALDALYSQGIDMRYLLDALATAWQHIATIQIVGEPTEETAGIWRESAEHADPAAVQLFYDITIAGIRDFAHAPDPLVGVRMTVLRMLAFAPDTTMAAPDSELPAQAAVPPGAKQPPQGAGSTPRSRESADATTEAMSGTSARQSPTKKKAAPRIEQPLSFGSASADVPICESAAIAAANATVTNASGVVAADPAPAARGGNGAVIQENYSPEDWHVLVERLEVAGFAAQLAHNGVCRRLGAQHIDLELARTHAFLATDSARTGLEQALARAWGDKPGPRLRVKVVDDVADTPAIRIEQDAEQRQRDAVAAIENDPVVRQLRDQLGAQLRTETIKPHRPPRAEQQRDEQ